MLITTKTIELSGKISGLKAFSLSSINALNNVSERNMANHPVAFPVLWKVNEAIKARIAQSIIEPDALNPPRDH